jgi:hypothetical protein
MRQSTYAQHERHSQILCRSEPIPGSAEASEATTRRHSLRHKATMLTCAPLSVDRDYPPGRHEECSTAEKPSNTVDS